MNKKIVISVIALATLITSFIAYTNFVKKYEIIINKEVISKDTSKKLDRIVDDEVKKYQKDLVKKSRTLVSDVEKKYNDELELSKLEDIEVKKVSKYEYKINVTHKVKRTMVSDIPYTSSTVEDPNVYNTYSAVQTAGVSGRETITFNSTYINGEFITFDDEKNERTEPINEVVVVGTLPLPIVTSSPSTSGGYNQSNNVANNYSSTGNNIPAANYSQAAYDACWAEGLARVEANGGTGSFMCLPYPDGTCPLQWWDI